MHTTTVQVTDDTAEATNLVVAGHNHNTVATLMTVIEQHRMRTSSANELAVGLIHAANDNQVATAFRVVADDTPGDIHYAITIEGGHVDTLSAYEASGRASQMRAKQIPGPAGYAHRWTTSFGRAFVAA